MGNFKKYFEMFNYGYIYTYSAATYIAEHLTSETDPYSAMRALFFVNTGPRADHQPLTKAFSVHLSTIV